MGYASGPEGLPAAPQCNTHGSRRLRSGAAGKRQGNADPCDAMAAALRCIRSAPNDAAVANQCQELCRTPDFHPLRQTK